jgi:hypothetical protein
MLPGQLSSLDLTWFAVKKLKPSVAAGHLLSEVVSLCCSQELYTCPEDNLERLVVPTVVARIGLIIFALWMFYDLNIK